MYVVNGTKPLASLASQSLYLVQFLIIGITKNMNLTSFIIFAPEDWK